MALSRDDELASAHLADEVGLAAEVVAADVFAITRGMGGVDGLAIQLGQQDVRYGMVHALRRTLEQIGEANQHKSIAQANGVVDVGKGIEANAEAGHLGAGSQLAVGMLE